MTASSSCRLRLFTVGHSNRTIDAFLKILEGSSIKVVADIRSNPASSRFPHFERHALSSFLFGEGISYRWFRTLGGRVPKTDDSSMYTALPPRFRDYASQMNQSDFTNAVEDLLGLAASATTVLLCAERDFHDCHRWILADKLHLMGARVTHIIDENVVFDHQLNPDLENDNGVVSYPAHQLTLL